MPKTTTILLFAILFVMVDIGTVHSQSMQCVLANSSDPATCIYDSLALSSIGLALSFAFVGIAFMVGEVFAIPGFKNWYKSEIWELIKSVILVVMIFSLLVVTSGIALALAGLPASSGSSSSATSAMASNFQELYTAAKGTYVDPQAQQATSAFAGILGFQIGLELMKSIQVSFYIPIPIPFVGAFDTGFDNINLFNTNLLASGGSSFTAIIADVIIVPTMIIFMVLSNYFMEIMYAGLLVFIPIGIFLRAIPFLRGIGGTMLAGGITLSLIFPTLLIAFNLPITNFLAPLTGMGSNISQPPCPSTSVSSSVTGILNDMICNALWTTIMPVITSITNAWSTAGAFGSGIFAGMSTMVNFSIYPALNFVTNYTLSSLLQFILFIFDVIISFAMGNSIARMLGGQLKLGIGKLKIV